MAVWNIRGLNLTLKQREVQMLISEKRLKVCAILESHVSVSNLGRVCKNVFRSWDWTSNGACCSRGTRIIVGWDNSVVDLMVIDQTDQHNELTDIKSHGMQYTWNQKPKNGVGILKKIDRVMGNIHFLDTYPDVYVLYHPFRVSDHTPFIINLQILKNNRPKPFKFANFLVNKDGFMDSVAAVWSKTVHGVSMYSVVKKLSSLKSPLRRLLFMQGNLHDRVNVLRKKLDEIQVAIDANPLDISLREAEAKCLQDFQSASYDEECFLKQKSKAE
ncbi:uncharacterized protein LOC110931923 [Helianthus annuus]|uniref:uncharacterized protein LOC110931923 n=1 Tax=Helianthus annuus TaxID=4232 RepID=UPI000B8EF999|nr:uncharacterized protein LOC110931923 [Helianthus annuus]